MQLNPGQLKNILSKPLSDSPVRIIWLEGKEPLLLQETRDNLLQWAQKSIEHRQLHQIDQSFDWEQLIAENASFGLFDESKIYDLRFIRSTIKNDDITALVQLLEVIDDQKFIIISSDKLEKKTMNLKAFKKLQDFIGIMTFWPMQSRDYPSWIYKFAKQHNLQFEQDTVDWLTSQHEGNLLALQQCLDRIAYTSDKNKTLSITDIKSSTLFQAKYTTFDVVDMAMQGQTVKALQAIQQLKSQGQEPILMLWAFNNGFEALDTYHRKQAQGQSMPWPQFKVFGPRIQIFDRAAKRMNKQQIEAGMHFAGKIDAMIKGLIKFDVWQAMMQLSVMMSQPQSPLVELTTSEAFEDYTQRV
ncbi:MAG: DNA polymerase III subunit delta [Gammaproteobacteria bacterium]|nr:DNA polymerase III subunit delta [Gammaproteobacteria bacterium]HBF08980.1 DNA polymerase III subunit delta [Gammaproteobacteria bacterium]